MFQTAQTQTNTTSSGARMVTLDGKALPLKSVRLSAFARGGIARVTLTQTFENPYPQPLTVHYSLPLPADGAVSGFSFLLHDRRVVGEVDRKAKARARYEQAIYEGRSASLLEQDRSSLFTQELGNIPPQSEIVAEILIDQRLLWLPEGAWEWRFPTVVAPRYLGEPGRVSDAKKITQEVASAPLPSSLSFSLLIGEALAEGSFPSSTSHSLQFEKREEGLLTSLESENGARLNQDIVIRWRASSREVKTTLSVCRPPIGGLDHQAFGLLTLVPPLAEAEALEVPRDLILLLDVSGSMSGAPIAQLKEVSRALIASLNAQDQLEMLVFANHTRRWKKTPVHATEAVKEEAIQWINSLRSSGGTEMHRGIIEALKPLRTDSQRQVIVMTDGHIGFEDEIVREVYQRLPKGSRVHTVGVGSSVNRSLTAPVARAGGGVEQIIGLRESAQKAAARLLARTHAPLVVGLRVGGDAVLGTAPRALPDLFVGAPALVSLALQPEGGALWIEGYTPTGVFRQELQAPKLTPNQGNQAISALYAREHVEDLEAHLLAGGSPKEINKQIEDVGVAFQIATRLTSWVAISKEITVDKSSPARQEVMPQELPLGMSAEALGLRPVTITEKKSVGQQSQKAADALQPITRELTRSTRESERSKLSSIDAMPMEDDLRMGDQLEMERSITRRSAQPFYTLTEETNAPTTQEESEELFEVGPDFEETKQRIREIEASALRDLQARSEPKKPKELAAEAQRSPAPSRQNTGKRVRRSQAQPASSDKKKTASEAPLILKGVIVSHAQDRLVISFTLPQALSWMVPQVAELLYENGAMTVTVDASRSTPTTALSAKATVQLELVLRVALPGKVRSLRFQVGTKQFIIEV